MARTTLLDIAKANGSDPVVGLIDEASRVHPEIQLITGRTIKGINYKTLVRTANPTVSFRSANDGVDAVKGTYEERMVETFILNPRWECDKAVADAYEDGASKYIAMEAMAITNAAFKTVSRQMYYGTANDAKGFPGLAASVLSAMTLDATGTTASTGSSVWGLTFGPQGVQWVVGMNGSLDMSDVREGDITGSNGKVLTGYIQEMLARIGLQVGNLNGVGRIKNLTEDSGKGLDDDKLADFIAKFPVGYKPEILLMTRRSRKQLQKSRTATNPSGTPAPTPTEYEGIPILATDSLDDTEAIA